MSLRALGVAVLLVAQGLVVASSAAEKRRRPGVYRLGPVYVTPRLQLKNAGVDTNVFQTARDPIRDDVVVISPRLEGVVPIGRRLRITGMTLLELAYYRRQGEERSVDYYGETRAELAFRPLLLFGGGGGGQFTQRFSIDVDERLTRQEAHGYAGATLKIGRRLSATGQGRVDVLTFAPGVFRLGGDVKQAMDRETLAGTGQLRMALTSLTTLVVSAEAREDHFFSQPESSPRFRRSYLYLAGFETAERALVSGRLLAGVRHFPGTLAQGSPPYLGPAVTADLVLPVRGRLRLRVVGERDVHYASSLVEVGTLRYRNAFLLHRYHGEALLELPLRLLGVVSGGFEESRYLLPYPYLSPRVLSDRVDRRWTAGASLLRRIGDGVRIGGHLTWARRVSSLPLFSYERVRYGLTAEVVP